MLNASHVLSFAACPRIVFLELHGDLKARSASSEFLVMLGEQSRLHKGSVIEGLSAHRVGYDRQDPWSGIRGTREALADGLRHIAVAPMAEIDSAGNLLRLGVADLLERVPGRSRFGDFQYEVVEIKRASRSKASYRLQVAYHSDLLARLQGVAPARGHLIMSDGRRESFDLAPLAGRYKETLKRLREIDAGVEPDVFVCSQCSACSWQGVCVPEAESQAHLSLVFGLPREAVRSLAERGIHDYHQLARQSPERVALWLRCGEPRARKFVDQARSLSSGTVVWRRDAGLPDSDTEIFFDIEGDPERGVLYLFGVLVREKGKESYRPFLAERPGQEARAFLECLSFLERWPQAPIYHYHHYERTVLDRLIERHGADPQRIDRLRSRLQDLSEQVSESCYLPVRSYSLKSVARYLGFEWSASNSSAVQSVVWFTSWQRTHDRAYLDQAVEYNADDCRATRVLKDWLASGPHGEAESPQEGLLAAVRTL